MAHFLTIRQLSGQYLWLPQRGQLEQAQFEPGLTRPTESFGMGV